MIDKNDVKMPVQKENMNSLLADSARRMQVEKLLELVNDAENKQELRLKSDYYSRFHWFGSSATRSASSYFSYQEEAVYDFIFNLNKSGILSDQVGMGKTIEAGMIISELASRNELRSLLIIVPNEIMATKWEYELEAKFGVKKHVIQAVEGDESDQVYPEVKALKNYDDFCRCVYECIAHENFGELNEEKFEHTYVAPNGQEESLRVVIERFIKEDIKKAVNMVNDGLSSEYDVSVSFDGRQFAIVGTKFKRPYVYDAKGEIEDFLNGKENQRQLDRYVNRNLFKKKYTELINEELNALYTLVGDYFTTIPETISTISSSMTEKYPILVIPIAYSRHEGENVYLEEFLNRPLLPKIENYRHKYNVKDEEGKIISVYEGYRIIDFFIDVAYQTIIVDEVHDYIDVCAKMERMAYHKNGGYNLYPSKDYNRYELFDDYYFIKKSSLYKKLKDLADNANRKIFLTATPIKSDMVDFYLLTLLASNKDAESYEKVRTSLAQDFFDNETRENAIEGLYRDFVDCVQELTAHYFSGFSSRFFVLEKDENGNEIPGRYRYPYFNNSFLKENFHNEKVIKDYILGQISYMSVEEVIMELILAYTAEMSALGKPVPGIVNLMRNLQTLLGNDANEFQTRVIFRALFDNNLKLRFEEDFTNTDGKAIKRIRELLELEEGARKWHKTYRKYGIRHTRHQTYNLSKCAQLDKLSANRIERYQNLPIWPRRDGKVIYLMRDDIFFDCFLDVKRERKKWGNSEVKVEDLPNYDKFSGSAEQKKERFENALAIFNYINDSMSGGDDVYHEPKGIKYESIDLDDSKVVDYKLALVNKLMTGEDANLGAVSKKVLLFVEEGRDKVAEWFRYQNCQPLCQEYDNKKDVTKMDPAKLAEYKQKWENYGVRDIASDWKVSEDAESLSREEGNVLIIIDPKRYEKGVDLQKADTIINFDINYCPLKMEQRIGRIDRIRPSGQSQGINIISFVLLNDMSGFIINFFANELKMFTQWMGETTGIVSVPEEDMAAAANKGEDVSFEGKVYDLEKYYKSIYNLCKGPVSDAEIEKMAKDFKVRFGVSETEAKMDFTFLKSMRDSFDRAFRNSISPKREGYDVLDQPGAKIIRFNSTLGPFQPCASANCGNCRNSATCRVKDKKVRNVYSEFVKAVNEFYSKGLAYYSEARSKYQRGNTIIDGGSNAQAQIAKMLIDREELFSKGFKEVKSLLPQDTTQSFTMPYEKFERIFTPMKHLYWDLVVSKYIQIILKHYYKQCDSVLQGASLFERFIKTLSIADFMNNMEGTL